MTKFMEFARRLAFWAVSSSPRPAAAAASPLSLPVAAASSSDEAWAEAEGVERKLNPWTDRLVGLVAGRRAQRRLFERRFDEHHQGAGPGNSLTDAFPSPPPPLTCTSVLAHASFYSASAGAISFPPRAASPPPPPPGLRRHPEAAVLLPMPQQADLEWFVVLRDIFPASEEVARVPRTIKDCWGHRGEHDEARLRELVAHDETFQTNVWKMMCPGAHSSDGELVSAGGVGGEVAGDHFIVDASGELVHGGGPSYLLSGPVSSCDAFVAPLVGSANCFAQGLSSPGSPPLVACRPSPVPARTLALASCRIAVQESWSGDDSFCPVVLTGGKGKGRAV